MNKVLIICGPTCTGKTSLSVKLAKELNGEIINGDSMQFYKEMNIGTAKIKEEEKDGVNHHLFDIISIKDSISIAQYQKLVREKIDEICLRGNLPIIVGGSGLYLKSALYDYMFIENKEENYNLENKTNEELYDLLTKLDPESASKIHKNNKKRIIRALQIYYEFGQGKESINKSQNHSPIYNTLFIGLTMDRKRLYELIDYRVDKMINEGLIDEVKYVLNNSSISSTSRQAIGYKEFNDYFSSLDTLDNCITKVKSNTHKFVKRQYTWFNHQMDVKWIDVSKGIDDSLKESLKLIKEWENE